MSKRGLGKGLDALLATSSFSREQQHFVPHPKTFPINGQLIDLSVNKLRPGMYQPRQSMASDALEELSASIQSQGIIQPIVVRQIENERYEIIAGERRWRAAKLAGLQHVPCLLKNVPDRAVIAMALIENIQREDLNVIEEAEALERLQNEYKLTHQQLGDVVGKSRASISNLLRLNQLMSQVKHLVAIKSLEMGHARALLGLENAIQVEVAEYVVSKNFTVRQTEAYVKKMLKPSVDKKALPDQEYVDKISEKMGHILGSKVSIVPQASGKAKIIITLDELHKIENILTKLEA